MAFKRCPRCGSRRVKKKGFTRSRIQTRRGVVQRELQRYLCLSCQKNFTYQVIGKRRRHSQDLIRAAVRRYLEDSASLRPVARGFGISARTLLN